MIRLVRESMILLGLLSLCVACSSEDSETTITESNIQVVEVSASSDSPEFCHRLARSSALRRLSDSLVQFDNDDGRRQVIVEAADHLRSSDLGLPEDLIPSAEQAAQSLDELLTLGVNDESVELTIASLDNFATRLDRQCDFTE